MLYSHHTQIQACHFYQEFTLRCQRLVLAAVPLGIMQACLAVVLPLVCQREQFGRPLGEFQFIQGKFVDLITKVLCFFCWQEV